MANNLNESKIVVDTEKYPEEDGSLRDYSISSDVDCSVNVYFREIKRHLMSKISEAVLIVGCVAWITDHDILDALIEVGNCQLVIQKEDFLRPDIDSSSGFGTELKDKYECIHFYGYKNAMLGIIPFLNISKSWHYVGVRCVGGVNRDKKPAFPRNHNKFLVFCKTTSGECSCPRGITCKENHVIYYPYAVWTGSFNFTRNATCSFENAIYIKSPKIAQAYFNEYSQIFALSEPLDWDSEWMSPEYLIG